MRAIHGQTKTVSPKESSKWQLNALYYIFILTRIIIITHHQNPLIPH